MKTTSAHFRIFERECRKWIKIFGLYDWEVFIQHNKIESRAEINYNLRNKLATITFSKEWTNYNHIPVQDIRLTAFHEVMELMLARLVVVGRSRWVDESESDEASHDVIRRLEHVVFRGNV